MTGTPQPVTEPRRRRWSRGLRPLLWWLLLVLVLFAIRTHQRLSEQTRLTFTVVLQGQSVGNEVSATLDRRPIGSGEQLSIGSHRFVILHPKAEPFSTNLFIWYGAHDLGQIVLQRSMGTLAIRADPPARQLTIRGPEFELTLTNSGGTTNSVPTDRYLVRAQYLHGQENREVTVFRYAAEAASFAPRLGTVQLTCNQAGASFQVLKAGNELLEAGEFPSMIREVPEGSYRVRASHHGHEREDMLAVKAGMTNGMEVRFLYGALELETEPPGAAVSTGDGRQWGTTPLRLVEVPVGHFELHIRREGYEPAVAGLEVSSEQTTTFRTNLLSINYAKSLKAAREYLAAGNYDASAEVATTALEAKPNDPEALGVQNEAVGNRSLRRAEVFGKEGDYIVGLKELELAVHALPDNEEARQLLADFKARVPEQIERERVERLERPRKMFAAMMERYSDARLFDEHELKTGKPVKEVENAILGALGTEPAFQVTRHAATTPETFEIEALQQFETVLGTISGRRQCLIVGGQTRDDETQVLFKVLEYKSEAVNKFSIGALIGAPVAVNYVPVCPARMPQMTDKLKAQLQEGVSNVTARIQRAIGQAPEGTQ
jgi:hypothetical protein